MAFSGDDQANGLKDVFSAPRISRFDTVPTDPSDGNNGNYRRPAVEYDEPDWHLGWTDGRFGQPVEENEGVLRSRAKLEWLEEMARRERQIGKLRAKVESLKNTLKQIQVSLQYQQAHYYELWKKREQDYQQFSFLLGFTYLIISILLICADIPLSIKLVADGLGTVFTQLWEAILLAVGIALASVTVKYFIDEFILPNSEKWKKLFDGFVFLFFLSTVVATGIFRQEMQEIYREALNSEKDISELVIEKQVSSEKIAFIGLTVTFALVGGCCFSVACTKLANGKQYFTNRRALEKIQQQENAVYLEFQEAQEALKAEELRLTREKNEYKMDEIICELRVNLYRHGYSRGYGVAETMDAGEGLYTRCEKALFKCFSKKRRSKFWDS